MAGNGILIGQMAKQAGTNPKTIRYYETIGLLPNPQRGENRYRLYSNEMVELLQFIKKAQGLGFTLSEIKEIVDLRRTGQEPCIHVRGLIARKIADLDQQLNDLIGLRKKLARLLAGSRKQARRQKVGLVICPHIEGVSLDLKAKGQAR